MEPFKAQETTGKAFVEYFNNTPNHYSGLQPLEVMKKTFSEFEYLGFLRGNILKYVMRYDKKGGVEDLKKAKHYLELLIDETA